MLLFRDHDRQLPSRSPEVIRGRSRVSARDSPGLDFRRGSGIRRAAHASQLLRVARQTGAAQFGPAVPRENIFLAVLEDSGAATTATGPVVRPLPADLVIGDFPGAVAVFDITAILDIRAPGQRAVVAQVDIPDALAALVNERAVLEIGLDLGTRQRPGIARDQIVALRDGFRVADPLAGGQGGDEGGGRYQGDGFHARLRGLVPGFPVGRGLAKYAG